MPRETAGPRRAEPDAFGTDRAGRRAPADAGAADAPARFFEILEGDGPVVAVALHHGHAVRPEVAELLAVDESDRLREEDPHTGLWTAVAPTRVIVHGSRFEVDLNRPRSLAVYRRPEEAWGLRVWLHEPGPELISNSLAKYDEFYDTMWSLLSRLRERFGGFVVFDLHSYNHRRGGQYTRAADEASHPEINVGTGTMIGQRFSPLVGRFIADLGACTVTGGALDVRGNVKFQGGHFARWVHERFPDTGCVLSIEVKKFFMDEWTGEVNWAMLDALKRALAATVPGVLEELRCSQVYPPLSARISSTTDPPSAPSASG